MSARRARSNEVVPGGPAGVDSVSNLGLLKDAQVHVGLGHHPHRRLQSPVMAIKNVVGAEPKWRPPPHRTPGTPTHPQLTESFLCFPSLRY